MNVLLTNQEVKVNVQHHSCVCNKDMLHVVVLIRSVLIPYEVTDKSSHHEPVAADRLEEVAFRLEHIVGIVKDRLTFLGLDRRLPAVKGEPLTVNGVGLTFYLR